jgi:hypothetical protein
LQLVLVVLVILLQQMVVRAPLVEIPHLIQLLQMVEEVAVVILIPQPHKMVEMAGLAVGAALDIFHKDLVAQEIHHQPAQVKEITAALGKTIQAAVNTLVVAVVVLVKQELLVEPHQTKVKVVMEQPQLLLALL